jgi:N-acetyl-gamma-glutamyl-phosphate reductase
MIKTGIIEGAGFTGGELIRLLLNHPDVQLMFITGRGNSGQKIHEVHRGLYGETELEFSEEPELDKIDLLFLITTAEESRQFMETHEIPERLKIIDFSRNYRLKDNDKEFIYGLPELNRRAICKSRYVANPGNFATCITLGLLPLAKNLMLGDDIYVHAIIGSTGTGHKASSQTTFSWRNDNVSIYKPFVHQHLPEIRESLEQLQSSFKANIHFVPYRGNFTRGIFCTIMVKNKVAVEELTQLYTDYYAKDSFTHVTPDNIDLKQVINTNKCLIHLEKHGDILLITSCIDNLLKGTSGQAVHNMNLLFNLEETTGLNLKATAY